MKTISKVLFIIMASLFIWAMSYHIYVTTKSRLTEWLNRPSNEQIKEQYRKVGY